MSSFGSDFFQDVPSTLRLLSAGIHNSTVPQYALLFLGCSDWFVIAVSPSSKSTILSSGTEILPDNHREGHFTELYNYLLAYKP